MSEEARNSEKQSVLYHYAIAVSGFLILFGYGIGYFTIGLYIDPVTETYGFTKGEFGLTIGLLSFFTAAGGMASPLVRARIGFKASMVVGSTLGALALYGMSIAQELYQFHFAASLLGVAGGLTSLIPVSSLITHWFVARRGLVMALVLSGTGLAGVIFSPLVTYLIETFSYKSAFLANAAVVAATLIPIIFLIQEKPQNRGLAPFGAESQSDDHADSATDTGYTLNEARKMRSFYLLAAGIAGYTICINSTLYFIPSMMREAGVDALLVGKVLSLMFLGVSVGKLAMGVINDRFGILVCVVYGTILLVSAMLLSNYFMLEVVLFVFVIAYGLSVSLASFPQTILISKIFGSKHYANIISIVSSIAIFASSVAPFIGGLMRDQLGSYNLLFLIAGAVCILCTSSVYFALRFRPKIAAL